MAKKPTTTTLIEKLKAMTAKHGSRYAHIARELNRQGIKTIKGKEWTDLNVRIFIGRHVRERAPQPARDRKGAVPPAPRIAQTQQDLPGRAFPTLNNMLWQLYRDGTLEGLANLYRTGVLSAVAQWWRETRGVSVVVQGRPVFKGPRRNTGIHCNIEILKRALKKAKTEKASTGGSLSQLVEVLLWHYIGEPQDLLDAAGK